MPPVPKSRVALFVVLSVFATAVDLGSKSVAFNQLAPGEEAWLLEGYAGFQLALNEGGLFGMGQGGQFWLAGFSLIAAVAVVVWLFVYRAAADLVLTITLAFVMGGILGNLYDRLGMHGLAWDAFTPAREGPVYAVRDFILLAWRYTDPAQRLVWPNFNVADSFLVVGAAVLFFRSMLGGPGANPPGENSKAA